MIICALLFSCLHSTPACVLALSRVFQVLSMVGGGGAGEQTQELLSQELVDSDFSHHLLEGEEEKKVVWQVSSVWHLGNCLMASLNPKP
jgi:hypothetical protein